MKILLTSMIATSLLSSGSLVIAQIVPKLPDEWGSWPPTAILGAVAMVSLGICCYVMRQIFLASKEHNAVEIKRAEIIGEAVAERRETNRALNELCSKLNNLKCVKDR